jgi:hypothetical protein
MPMTDDHIKKFVRRLRSAKRHRVDLKVIWDAYRAVYGNDVGGVDARDELLKVLEQLRDADVLTFPSDRGRGWDRNSTVVLPLWVTLVESEKPTSQRGWRTFPWHPALAWVVKIGSLSADQEVFMGRLQEELVSGGLRERAPFKYRSLQLTGSEKRLEGLLSTQLFKPGRLTLELLNCDGLGLPLTYERVGLEPRMIIFENAGSFLVARRVLVDARHAPYGLIAYGGGNQVLRCVDYLKEIHDLAGVDYVGDLDAKGIDIGGTFADLVSQQTRLPVLPATAVHLAMIDAARELGHPQGWPTASGHQTRKLNRWLAPECAETVKNILASGNRIPEEVLHDGHYTALWHCAV